MRLLLDTHVVLWWLGDLPRLGDRTRTAIEGAADILVSAVSGYEITFKQSLGKLRATDELDQYLEMDGFRALPVTMKHAATAGRLPLHDRDPFDRLLVAQARCEGLTLVTADHRMSAYDVPLLDATR